MRDILVDQAGDLRCPKCHGKNFDHKRSLKAKVAFGVGALLVPKRIKCLNCGEMSKGGDAKKWIDPALNKPASATPAPTYAPPPAPPEPEKVCPMCAETVKEAAKICRYCNHGFQETST